MKILVITFLTLNRIGRRINFLKFLNRGGVLVDWKSDHQKRIGKIKIKRLIKTANTIRKFQYSASAFSLLQNNFQFSAFGFSQMWKWRFGYSLVVLSKTGDVCKIWIKIAVSLHLILFLAQNFMHAILKQDNREVLRTNLWSLNKRLGPNFITSWSIQLHST